MAPGTLITLEEDAAVEAPAIAGIAFNRDEAKLTVLGVPDIPVWLIVFSAPLARLILRWTLSCRISVKTPRQILRLPLRRNDLRPKPENS